MPNNITIFYNINGYHYINMIDIKKLTGAR